jgi:hypothetical protein
VIEGVNIKKNEESNQVDKGEGLHMIMEVLASRREYGVKFSENQIAHVHNTPRDLPEAAGNGGRG